MFKVLDVLFDPGFPKVFQSREWMLQHLTNTHKLDKSIALWLLTSVAPSLEVKGSFTWTLDFKVIELLFKDFCQQSMLEFLSDYDGDGSIHFLRAGRNMQWSREIIDEINSMQSNRIHLHTMPDVGHWVHRYVLLYYMNLIPVTMYLCFSLHIRIRIAKICMVCTA